MRTLPDTGTPGALPWITPEKNRLVREIDLDFAFGRISRSTSAGDKTWTAHVGVRHAPHRRITLDDKLRHRRFPTLEKAVAWAEWELRDEVSAHQRMAIVRAHNAAKGDAS